jgi:lysyl-tRNA synthetase, class II
MDVPARRSVRNLQLVTSTATDNHRDSAWVPRLGAAITALLGLVNIASALTPDISWRGHLLLQFEALQTMRMFHALALPAGAALLLVAPYLWIRRRRALQVAIGLLLVLGVVNLLKGLDYEETLLGWATAGGLFRGRGAFTVVQVPITLRSAIWRVPLLGALCLALVTVADWISHGQGRLGPALRESGALLLHNKGPLGFESHSVLHHHFAWIPLSVHFVEIGTLLAIAYVIFRPIAAPKALPGPSARRLAADIVRAHGGDTLSFFKLRADKQYFFNEQRTAFVGYRIEAGVLVLSGDPVGPPETFPGLLLEVRAFAAARALKLGAIGASERLLPLHEGLGLRSLYLGDEAIIDLTAFSLEGRPIRKVRQSVSRLTKAGYSAELRTLADLEPETLWQIERVIELGRMGAPEIGFSMAMDSIRGEGERDTLFVLARDGEHRVRGLLHFVPCYGRRAASLSMMRRDPETPNGLTEFLVCSAVTLLRERGLEEMSLNFATAARYMHAPGNAIERLVGRLARVFNPYFQIESLYRFNAKFFPRWEPRYFVYEGRLGLPRACVAGMWAEGQLRKPALPKFVHRARRPADMPPIAS